MVKFIHKFEDLFKADNLLSAWTEFARGKRGKIDVQEFSFCLSGNIIELKNELVNGKYRHGGYEAFNISDPKPRNIHKATVRDRLVHHAVHRVLYPFFDRKFIADSYSCRIGKGTHRALKRFLSFGRKVSHSNTCTAWVLKCDIRKFFASIDHEILFEILRKHIADERILRLLQEIVSSFSSTRTGVGLPLGNLTSQLLVNIYMNEFDQFVKHGLKMKYYIRYADDFVFFSRDKSELLRLITQIEMFLWERLRLTLHPAKLYLKTLASGVDFLGWINFPEHRVLRTTTKRRMIKRLRTHPTPGTLASYAGLLRHGNTRKLKENIHMQIQI